MAAKRGFIDEIPIQMRTAFEQKILTYCLWSHENFLLKSLKFFIHFSLFQNRTELLEWFFRNGMSRMAAPLPGFGREEMFAISQMSALFITGEAAALDAAKKVNAANTSQSGIVHFALLQYCQRRIGRAKRHARSMYTIRR